MTTRISRPSSPSSGGIFLRGPAGPIGPRGPQGIQGPPGDSISAGFRAEMFGNGLFYSVTDNTLRIDTAVIATVEQVRAIIDDSVGSLDTLNELANAIGNDPDFYNTITTLINNELVRATEAEDILQDNITSETVARTANITVLRSELESEIDRAQTTENTLLVSINNEIIRSVAAEAVLQGKIDEAIELISNTSIVGGTF